MCVTEHVYLSNKVKKRVRRGSGLSSDCDRRCLSFPFYTVSKRSVGAGRRACGSRVCSCVG